MCIILKLNAKRITALLVFACHCYRDLSYAYCNDQHPYFASSLHTGHSILSETSTQDETPPHPITHANPKRHTINTPRTSYYSTSPSYQHPPHTNHTPQQPVIPTLPPQNPSVSRAPSPCSNNHLTSPRRNPYVTHGHRACFRSDYAV